MKRKMTNCSCVCGREIETGGDGVTEVCVGVTDRKRVTPLCVRVCVCVLGALPITLAI